MRRSASHTSPALGRSSPPLPVDDADRVGQSSLSRDDELQVELGQIGLGPAHLRQPLGHPLLARGRELVDLAVRTIGGAGGLLARDQPGLLQAPELNVGNQLAI